MRSPETAPEARPKYVTTARHNGPMGTPVASTSAIVANRMQSEMAMPATCFSVMIGMSSISVSGE
eukprot:scaffold88325_cov108-Phaeocystis_antarctica.AAC.3